MYSQYKIKTGDEAEERGMIGIIHRGLIKKYQ